MENKKKNVTGTYLTILILNFNYYYNVIKYI